MTDVMFVAGVDLNATIRIGLRSFPIVARRESGEPWPAGVPFPVPADLADEFERLYGPRPNDASVSTGARDVGRIAGLRRVQEEPHV